MCFWFWASWKPLFSSYFVVSPMSPIFVYNSGFTLFLKCTLWYELWSKAVKSGSQLYLSIKVIPCIKQGLYLYWSCVFRNLYYWFYLFSFFSPRNFEYLSKEGDRMKFDLAQAQSEARWIIVSLLLKCWLFWATNLTKK